MPPNSTNNVTKQSGSVIIYTLSVLGIIFSITFTLVAIFVPKIRAVNDAVNSSNAIYAADSATEWCLYQARTTVSVPNITFDNSGLSYTFTFVSPAGALSCDTLGPLFKFQATGTYRGVSRTFEVQQGP